MPCAIHTRSTPCACMRPRAPRGVPAGLSSARAAMASHTPATVGSWLRACARRGKRAKHAGKIHRGGRGSLGSRRLPQHCRKRARQSHKGACGLQVEGAGAGVAANRASRGRHRCAPAIRASGHGRRQRSRRTRACCKQRSASGGSPDAMYSRASPSQAGVNLGSSWRARLSAYSWVAGCTDGGHGGWEGGRGGVGRAGVGV